MDRKQALRRLDISEKVVPIGDHLGYGPIGDDFVARRAWLKETLGEGFSEEVDRAAIAWNEALAPDRFPIIWNWRSDAGDFAGFLEFVSRIGSRPFEIVDATELTIKGRPNGAEALALGIISDQDMADTDLPRRRSTLTREEADEYRGEWRRLKDENALLRVIEAGALTSKPPSYFDATLLEHVPADWERGVRIVGRAMTDLMMTGRLVSDSFIWWRYCVLESQGAIEFDELPGEANGMRGYRLRLASRNYGIILPPP